MGLSPEFANRRNAAIAALQATTIRNRAAPPLHRLLWKLGFEVRPPFFQSFFTLTLLFGIPWGVGMGAFVALGLLPHGNKSPLVALIALGIASLLFGIIMAAFFRFQARKHRLPKWEELNPQNT